MSEKIKTIVIAGPTASGKTALSIEIAKRYNGEVVSADSMQIYTNMPIASAAVTEEEADGIKHHLVGFASPTHRFSVAEFVGLADIAVNDINERNKLPIITGGTGLYLDSLISGVRFSREDSTEIRAKLEAEADEKGIAVLLERLKTIDPLSAAKLHLNDRKRIIRALEIFELHKIPKSQLDEASKLLGERYDTLWLGITYRDRELLYERINKRVDQMLEKGLLDEAREAFLTETKATSVQAIGHKELFPYFKGEMSLEQVTEGLKTETRRYAKRQLTWFRRNDRINWIYADETPDMVRKACEYIDKFLNDF